MLAPMVPLKDEMLSRLAAQANVAQFVSFGPGGDLPQRHSCLRGHAPGHRFASAGDAVGALLSLASGGSVNVRSFRAGAPKGGPFSYGLTRRDDVLAVLRARAGDGLHTIANETVDVHDGGVSGVALGGVVEFAPGDTPRSVESPGTTALGHDHAMALLRTVYGFTPGLDGRPGERIEFSIHPLAAGVRQAHTILWERERVDPVTLAPRLTWPNRFSRLLGDKAFGLLVADLLGLPVPATTVVGRRVAPFSFGRPTGSGERWLRTCPAEPVPGRFPTQRGWRDPFALLAAEDPSGADVVAVLAQEGVGARWSGAALPDAPAELAELRADALDNDLLDGVDFAVVGASASIGDECIVLEPGADGYAVGYRDGGVTRGLFTSRALAQARAVFLDEACWLGAERGRGSYVGRSQAVGTEDWTPAQVVAAYERRLLGES